MANSAKVIQPLKEWLEAAEARGFVGRPPESAARFRLAGALGMASVTAAFGQALKRRRQGPTGLRCCRWTSN